MKMKVEETERENVFVEYKADVYEKVLSTTCFGKNLA